jgi:di/tricarboxylate transporter
MSIDQYILFSLIGLIFVFLIWGRIRYDIVAFSSLVAAFILGVIPQDQVFSGFGHPAVVIIALVLIVSRGLSLSGAVELLARWMVDSSRSLQSHIGTIAGISAALSAVMNNVAALALLMPVDMQAARRAKRSPALSLMPLSFASILGGMVTMIGTPPNIVIATFREDALGEAYSMFDFTPVGLVVAITGVLYVALAGWRLIPVDRRKRDTTRELEEVNNYVSEARVTEASPLTGKRLRESDSLAGKNDINVVGLIRRGKRLPGSARLEVVRKNDLVLMEGSPEDIDRFVGAAGLEFGKSGKSGGITSETQALIDAVVPEGSWIIGRSAMDIRLLYRRGVTLLGISRK